MTDSDEKPRKSKRGFAAMDPEKQRAIAHKGGVNVPSEKRSFSKSLELAAEAGKKGGKSLKPGQRGFAKDRALAAEAGRKGGAAPRKRKQPDEKDG